MATAEEIDALLPQTQCTRCGYPGCLPYARAIAADQAPINQCPPGGAATIAMLARLLHCAALPLNPQHGTHGAPLVALIDEERCIGCAKCLPPCPVDAIIGARRQMHTVLSELCTGCELCVAPCPVDCIVMRPRADVACATPEEPPPHLNRLRFEAHTARMAQRAVRRDAVIAARKNTARADGADVGHEPVRR
ncbi:MAG TPA: RnfABCDGE type electron transport complex subunit B [Steroidobacteraceae bacterium]